MKANRLAPVFHIWIQPVKTFSQPPESNPMETYAAVLYAKSEKFHWPSGGGDQLWKDHIEFIKSEAVTSKLAAGGPFKDGTGDEIALLIFTTSPEEAMQIVARDPLVQSGEVKPVVHPWTTQKGVLPK